jgi:hypothetical protein
MMKKKLELDGRIFLFFLDSYGMLSQFYQWLIKMKFVNKLNRSLYFRVERVEKFILFIIDLC